MKQLLIYISIVIFFTGCISSTSKKEISGKDTTTQSSELPKGYFKNPVIAGDYADPSILRVGNEYYMTHSSFDYAPGLKIWHSVDLVNREPVGYALEKNI